MHKQTSNPDHPFHKFSVGNKHTLSDLPDRPVADELFSFWHQNYQAQYMTVSIVTAEPIEMMRDLIATTFSAIKSNDPKFAKSRY
ncbi:insulinase family protein [Psychrosphaera algicola]|uniref:insulinase family protein n=1 Tax=Psychrosphaera algicola TaxID=3023714 RepID=UPI00351D73F7